MSYHTRLNGAEQRARRATDREPEEGFGLLRCGLGALAVAAMIGLVAAALWRWLV